VEFAQSVKLTLSQRKGGSWTTIIPAAKVGLLIVAAARVNAGFFVLTAILP
jgi:hypothetical protein